MCDGGKEAITEQTCGGGEDGDRRVRRGWESRRKGWGRSGAVVKGGEQACLQANLGLYERAKISI